jgi:hypothetical protein
MKIINLIQLGNSGTVCKSCRWFLGDPAIVEKTYPGLSSMSSGFASVRDQDGFCNYHQRYLSARDSCLDFALRIAGTNEEEVSARNFKPG